MTTILLLGKTGQVGYELQETLAPLGTLIAPDRAQLDLAKPDSIRSVLLEVKPDIIVNAAGFTLVDAAEAQPELALQLNATAPGIIAEVAKQIGAQLIHFSTTFVFDGTRRTPYTEDDPPNPVNSYGRSKLAAEHAIQSCGGAHIIIRANWIYGHRRTNFALKILELARERKEIAVVDDQIGAPTWARDYAIATAQMLRNPTSLRDKSGVYNLSAAGQCTRFDWASLIIDCAKTLGRNASQWAPLVHTTSEAFSAPAARPLYTVTNNSKARKRLGIELQPWDFRVRAFMQAQLLHTIQNQ